MIRPTLIGTGLVWLLTGAIIFADPMGFYERTPGLKLMGPFNMHFVRDVGIAFVASGATLTCGGWTKARALVLAGSAWPVLHAVFHVQIWGHRGFPLDGIFAFDLLAVIAPPVLVLLLARKFGTAHG
jgi:hypothetical protein